MILSSHKIHRRMSDIEFSVTVTSGDGTFKSRQVLIDGLSLRVVQDDPNAPVESLHVAVEGEDNTRLEVTN